MHMCIQGKIKSLKWIILGIPILILINAFTLTAQINTVGTPILKNYSGQDFGSGQQNWMMDQSVDGRMYFANNDGLLEFDGVRWNLNPMPGGVIMRSLLASDDGKIYAGGYNEFGFFQADETGQLNYHSFIEQLPSEVQDFDEIWRIHKTPDGIVFQSFKRLFILNNNKITVVEAPGIFHFSYYVNGQLLIVDLEKGLLRYTMESFFPLVGTESLKGITIWAILPIDNKLLLATSEQGIYIYDGNSIKEWKNPASEFLEVNQVYSALRLDENFLAFGTIQNGLLICNNDGSPMQKVNRSMGLQNNTVLCLKKDDFGNLWVGTDNGIDYLEISSPISILSYEQGISASYTAAHFDNYLYLGTNQGVFYKKWDDFVSGGNIDQFKPIANIRGQVWTLKEIDGVLFCGNNSGTHIINGTEAEQISDLPGGWTYQPHPKYPDKIIGGTYSGLVLYSKVEDEWKPQKKIEGFDESSRILEIDKDGSIWMSHGFKGAFHIFLNKEMDSVVQVDFYNSDHGFQSDIGTNVARVNDKIYFLNSGDVYEYIPENDVFQVSNIFSEQFRNNSLSKIVEDAQGNLWYFSDNRLGVMRLQEDGNYSSIYLPFLQLEGSFIGGFEYVHPIDNENVLIGASNGFYHYNQTLSKNYQKSFSAYINEVRLPRSDSIIFLGHSSATTLQPDLKHRFNALYFSFSANDYENPERVEFSTFLEGYDKSWTVWDNRSSREYTNLAGEDYIFYVKARNIYGYETETNGYRFSIEPHWTRTTTAYILYFSIFLLVSGMIYLVVRKKIEKSNQQEKILQQEKFKEREENLQKETLEAEKEIIRLKNEKLSEQMILKDKELANSTLDMIQKNKLLTKIKTDLKKLSSTLRDEEQISQINKLSRRINRELDTEKQWEVFETHFENVHEAFLKRLKNQYPDLSPRELKLCAYLRLNISSKEIAVLMNISTRGVEISRYRLRKKLTLNRNENLTDFILSY